MTEELTNHWLCGWVQFAVKVLSKEEIRNKNMAASVLAERDRLRFAVNPFIIQVGIRTPYRRLSAIASVLQAILREFT